LERFDLFESADDLAERMGVSRSELYARAVAEYLAKHRDEDVTARLNEVFAEEPSGQHRASEGLRCHSDPDRHPRRELPHGEDRAGLS
jgi:hypothetical protein